MEMAVEHRPSAKPVAKPVCSVCIANYNGMQTIDACVDSVLSQDFDLPVEIIIHDDASTDASVEHINNKYPNIELLISRENKGFCISNNRMVDAASGQYILLLNNDAELYPNALDTLHKYSENQQRPGILSLPQYDRATGDIIDYGMDLDPFLNPIPRKTAKKQQVGTVHGACLWVPTGLWHKLGGFPEWFESVAEDLYLCVYAWNTGYSVEVPNKSGYLHWVGQSFGGGIPKENKLITTYERRALSERNKTYVMLLFYPWYTLPHFILHFLLLLTEGAVLSLLLRNVLIWKNIYVKAFTDTLSNRSQILFHRRRLQLNSQLRFSSFISKLKPYPRKLQLIAQHGLPSFITKDR